MLLIKLFIINYLIEDLMLLMIFKEIKLLMENLNQLNILKIIKIKLIKVESLMNKK